MTMNKIQTGNPVRRPALRPTHKRKKRINGKYFPFGKYAGRTFDRLPLHYLAWLTTIPLWPGVQASTWAELRLRLMMPRRIIKSRTWDFQE